MKPTAVVLLTTLAVLGRFKATASPSAASHGALAAIMDRSAQIAKCNSDSTDVGPGCGTAGFSDYSSCYDQCYGALPSGAPCEGNCYTQQYPGTGGGGFYYVCDCSP